MEEEGKACAEVAKVRTYHYCPLKLQELCVHGQLNESTLQKKAQIVCFIAIELDARLLVAHLFVIVFSHCWSALLKEAWHCLCA